MATWFGQRYESFRSSGDGHVAAFFRTINPLSRAPRLDRQLPYPLVDREPVVPAHRSTTARTTTGLAYSCVSTGDIALAVSEYGGSLKLSLELLAVIRELGGTSPTTLAPHLQTHLEKVIGRTKGSESRQAVNLLEREIGGRAATITMLLSDALEDKKYAELETAYAYLRHTFGENLRIFGGSNGFLEHLIADARMRTVAAALDSTPPKPVNQQLINLFVTAGISLFSAFASYTAEKDFVNINRLCALLLPAFKEILADPRIANSQTVQRATTILNIIGSIELIKCGLVVAGQNQAQQLELLDRLNRVSELGRDMFSQILG